MDKMNIPLGDQKRLKRAIARLPKENESLPKMREQEEKEREICVDENEEEELRELEEELRLDIGKKGRGDVYCISELVARGRAQQQVLEEQGKQMKEAKDKKEELVEDMEDEEVKQPDNFEKAMGVLESFKGMLLNMTAALEDTKPSEIGAFVKKVKEAVKAVTQICEPLTKVSGLAKYRVLLLGALQLCVRALEHLEDGVLLKTVFQQILRRLFIAVEYLERRLNQWGKEEVREIVNQELEKPVQQAIKIVGAILGAGVLGGFLAVGVATVALPLLGFSAAGVVSGTVAAAWMATYGGTVSATSLFAVYPYVVVFEDKVNKLNAHQQALQSAGVVGFGAVATGGIALVGVGIGVGVAASICGGIYGYKRWKRYKEQKDKLNPRTREPVK